MKVHRGTPAAVPGSETELAGRIRWLMILRLVVTTVMLGVTVLLQLGEGAGFYTTSLRALYLFAGFAYLLTIVYAAISSRIRDQAGFARVQLGLDIVLLSGVVLVTGGVSSPFLVAYFLIIIGAGILFYRTGSLIAAVASSALYGVAVGAPFVPRVAAIVDPAGYYLVLSGTIVGYRHLLTVFGFFLTAFLASYLTESLRKVGRQLNVTSASLAELERRSEHILQNIASGLVTTDLEGRITYCNRAAERIANLSTANVIGKTFAEIFRIQVGTAPWGKTGLPEGVSLRIEGRIVGRGEEPLLGMTFSPLRGEDGRMTGAICSFQDLTQIRRMEEQVRRSDRLAAIGELAAGMAHEIRNPLASLSGSITMLREGLRLEGTDRELMEIVSSEVSRLDSLITDFLTYASPRTIQPRECDLVPLLNETALLLRRSRAGDCRVEVLTPDGPSVCAEVDPQFIRQVFWNLSLNAVEAMPGGGLLKITVSGNATFVNVAFSDSGVGIAPAARAKIFTPFFSTKEQGTGLGLAIVFKIVEAHGGHIEVESHPGEGTTIRVILPVRRSSEPAVSKLVGGAA